MAGEDRPDLSCHSPDAPCSLVPGLDYPRILGMESRTWRITDRIVEDYNRYLWCFRDGDVNIGNLGCVIMSAIVLSPDKVEAATEEGMA